MQPFLRFSYPKLRLIDAADEIEKEMGKDNFYEYIRVTMGGNLEEEWTEILKETENQAISLVLKLFFCPMITTNFDQIIEKIYQGISKEETDTNIIFQALKKWTEENENYLFLLDNLDNEKGYDYINMFLDSNFSTLKGTRHILITSRLDKDKLPNIPILPIKEFELEESRSFLQSHTDTNKYNEEYADKIAILLGNLPLALEQAAAIIDSNKNETYKNFYKELEKAPFEKLEAMHPEPGAVPVAATWNMAMQRINSKAAKELLNLCAFFAPDNIHSQWFIDAIDVLPDDYELKNKVLTDFAEIKKDLKAYSLVRIDNEEKISLHRLLQEVVRKTFKDEQENLINTCLQILDKQKFLDFSTPYHKYLFHELASHIVFITRQILLEEKTGKITNLYHFLGNGCYILGDYKNALDFFQKTSTGVENALSITFLHNFASVGKVVLFS